MELAARLACPACLHHPLRATDSGAACPSCGRSYPRRGHVLDLLLPDKLAPLQQGWLADWESEADRYVAQLGALPEHRIAPIDRPLLAAARGDVVEVGCGDGRLLARVGGRSVRSVLGVEPSLPLANAAGGKRLRVVRAPAERLPLPNESADAVLAGYYALRYADLDAALAETARVLRPGGRLAFTLLGRRAVELAARSSALPMLLDRDQRRTAAALLLGRLDGAVLPNDVADAAALVRRLDGHGFGSVELLGTPYAPLVTASLGRLTGGRLPYLRGKAAVLGFDVVVLARRR